MLKNITMTLTPEQFNLLATKEDLKNTVNGLVTKNEFNEFKNDFYNTMDVVVKKLDNIEHFFVSNMVAHDRFETRITRVEKHLDLKPDLI
ncbi:MAG: hypothetical protein V1765_00340 [bacterium]